MHAHCTLYILSQQFNHHNTAYAYTSLLSLTPKKHTQIKNGFPQENSPNPTHDHNNNPNFHISKGSRRRSDILTDFIPPPNSPPPNATFFTFTGFRSLVTAPVPPKFQVLKATMEQFPALNGQSVSYAVLMYPPASVNPVHTHPRAAELLFLTQGQLEVGFVDSTNKLYTQTLQGGDLFVFPKGLVHFQYNADATNPAFAISAFGSAAAGTVSLPNSLFNSTIDDTVLALSFKTDVSTIQKLKAGLKG